MTEKDVRIVAWISVTNKLFLKQILSNPDNLKDVLLAVASELDERDIALITIAVAGSVGDPKKFFRDFDRFTQERYHPKPPWAV